MVKILERREKQREALVAAAERACAAKGLSGLKSRELARYAHGAPASDFVLPPSRPHRIFAHSLVEPFVSGLIQYYAFRDAMEIRRLERDNPATS